MKLLYLKKITTLFCLIAVLMMCRQSTYAQTATPPSAGDGSSGAPYEIATLNNLYWLATQVNSGTDFAGKFFKQTANINASSTSTWFSGQGWMPIGYSTDNGFATVYTFSGNYDGQNHIISNLYMNRSPFFCGGLFGVTVGASISNVGLPNVSLTVGTGSQGLGALIGWVYNSTVDNCYATGNISGDQYVGGLIGYLDGSSGDNSLSNSYFNGTVSAKTSVGGLCGDASSPSNSINKCYSAGSVTGTVSDIGGLIGHCSYSTVSNCYSTSAVSGNQNNGGLIGSVDAAATLNYCYATGSVSGTSGVGGLIGHDGSAPTMTGCLWDTQTTGQSTSAGGGTGKTTTEMQTKSTYTGAGWDFTGETANGTADYWGIASGYPFLASFGMKITTSDFSSGSDDITAFTKTYLNTDFTITPVSHNYSSIETNSGFNGFYSYDHSTANGTEFTISAPGYSFDLSAFKYYLESWRLPSLTVTLTFRNGSTDVKTYTFTGASTGVYTFSSFTTVPNDVTSIKFVSDNYMPFNNFIIDDIKALPRTWNGTAWSPSAPTASVDAIINGNYSGTGFSCHDFTINAGKQVTITSGTLAVGGNLTLKSDAANGTATLINSGTLTVGGTTSVEQYLSSSRNWYVSSPLSGANAPSGYTFFQYNEPGDNTSYTSPATAYWKSVNAGDGLAIGRGYIAQLASGTSTITFTGGTLNTGDKTLSLTRTAGKDKEGFNLVGNPYPSYLNIDDLKSNTDIDPTYWYRSKTSSYVFDTYNILSGVNTSNSGLAVTANIPPMQAFWLRVTSGKSTASVVLKNANRGHQDNSNNKFRVPAASNETQKILRLQVSNGTNSDEAVVYFNQNAADEFDAYDSEKMSNNNATIPELYTLAGTEKAVINGLNKVTPNKELALGFTTGETNTFTIKATEIGNFDTDTKIILKDKLLNIEQELTSATYYSFSSDPVSTASRFSIIFRSASTVTGIDNTADSKLNITIFRNENGYITITRNDAPGEGTVTVSNALGQKLTDCTTTGTTTVVTRSFLPGVYLVTVNLSGRTTTQKIILN